MTISELLQWQWSDYQDKHRHRINLLLHILAVPLFMVGCFLLAFGALKGFWFAGAGLLAMLMAFVLQAFGHKMETQSPAPFQGLTDFARRFFFEQWITFPRYVLSGGWLKAFRD